MKTQILKIKNNKIDREKIKQASILLKKDELVAFPTETVYGLGANALSSRAIKKIFEAKNRPADNPLIVHIAKKSDLKKYTKNIPKIANRLISSFWPGPLTIILEKNKLIPKIATAGLDYVAIRMPANKIALELIKESGVPLAAPSANLSTKPSPTLAKHVIEDLNGKIAGIIDGGSTKIGLESTVLDLTTTPPTLLRPGDITIKQIENLIGPINLPKNKKNQIITKSPGTKYRHYSPKTKIYLFEGNKNKVNQAIQKLINSNKNKKIGVITNNKNSNYKNTFLVHFIGSTEKPMARNLFKVFRDLDEKKLDFIVAEGINDENLGLAIMNRLRKASHKIKKIKK